MPRNEDPVNGYKAYEGNLEIGNDRPGDGAKYHGRGFIQLTGKYNYKVMSKKVGVNLEASPERANEPAIAAKVFAYFLKEREHRIRITLRKNDLATLRKIVNGGGNGLDNFKLAWQELSQ